MEHTPEYQGNSFDEEYLRQRAADYSLVKYREHVSLDISLLLVIVQAKLGIVTPAQIAEEDYVRLWDTWEQIDGTSICMRRFLYRYGPEEREPDVSEHYLFGVQCMEENRAVYGRYFPLLEIADGCYGAGHSSDYEGLGSETWLGGIPASDASGTMTEYDFRYMTQEIEKFLDAQ